MGSARAQNPARGGACARRKSHGAAGCFARLQLVGGEFALKKRALRNQRNLLSHSALTIKSGHVILVLTEKTGLFWVMQKRFVADGNEAVLTAVDRRLLLNSLSRLCAAQKRLSNFAKGQAAFYRRRIEKLARLYRRLCLVSHPS